MVKRPLDLPVFDGLFDDFFSGMGRLAAGLEKSDAVPANPAEYQELLDRLEELLDSLGGEISPLARELLLNDQGELEKLLRDLADSGQVPAPRSPSSQQGAVRAAAKALGCTLVIKRANETVFFWVESQPGRRRGRPPKTPAR